MIQAIGLGPIFGRRHSGEGLVASRFIKGDIFSNGKEIGIREVFANRVGEAALKDIREPRSLPVNESRARRLPAVLLTSSVRA